MLTSDNSMVFKFVLLGDATVGKTSFARRITKKRFRPKYHKTIGVDISNIELERQGKEVTITIWDLSGDINFRQVRSYFFSGTTGVILMIDVTKELNYDSLISWFEDIGKNMASKISIALLGNKIDLEDQVIVTPEFLEGTAIILNDEVTTRAIRTFQVSAKTGEGCIEALNWLVDQSIDMVSYQERKLREVFDPTLYKSALFKLTEVGPDVVFHDFKTGDMKESLDVFLLNTGIALATAIGQGHTYNAGTYDLPGGRLKGHRLLVYSFRISDPRAMDARLKIGFFIFVIFVPEEKAEFFDPFSKGNEFFVDYFSKFQSADDITLEEFTKLKSETFAEYEDMYRAENKV